MNSENRGIIIVVGILLVVILGAFLLGGRDQDATDTELDTVVVETPEVDMDDSEMDEDMSDEMEVPTQNIVEIAAGDENFSTLVTAVTEAGLVETLSGPGPFTVFAPTNDAFDKLPAGTLDTVLADQEQLTAILTYHVVSGEVMAEDVVTLDSATTVQGSDVTIEVDADGNVFVNDAQVVITDIKATNGVIHVIDTVLLPE